jgi:SAM-dependent methyltransferase
MTTEGSLGDGLPDVKMTPTSFRRSHVVTDPDGELAGLVFVLDFQEQNPAVGRLRDWTLDRLAAQPGETAVDVGCGTGAEVRRLAQRVGPAGRAVGIEPHAGLRAIAEQRSDGSGAEFVDGDALDLPFADGSVDVLRCERVWQHLDDAPRAAREVARVLAPGGRAAILDSDWGTTITSPADPDVVNRYNQYSWSRMANPFAGRHLRGQLTAAGLVVDAEIGSAAMVMPDEATRDPKIFRTNSGPAVEEGVLTQDEVEAAVVSLREATDRGAAFLSVTMFSVVARR